MYVWYEFVILFSKTKSMIMCDNLGEKKVEYKKNEILGEKNEKR